MIKNLILDYNGVISDDFTIVYHNVNKILKKFGGQEITYETLRDIFEIPQSNIYKKLLPHVNFDEINKYFFEIYDADSKPKAYPRVKETIDTLHQREINLIILSSHDKDRILSELKSFDITHSIFKEIVGNTNDKRLIVKPLPGLKAGASALLWHTLPLILNVLSDHFFICYAY